MGKKPNKWAFLVECLNRMAQDKELLELSDESIAMMKSAREKLSELFKTPNSFDDIPTMSISDLKNLNEHMLCLIMIGGASLLFSENGVN